MNTNLSKTLDNVQKKNEIKNKQIIMTLLLIHIFMNETHVGLLLRWHLFSLMCCSIEP